LEAIAGALGARYGPMIIFAAATGLWPAEWVALEKRDINQSRQQKRELSGRKAEAL